MPPEATGVTVVPLVAESGGESWTFDRPFTVGRVAPADVVLDNARVSRRHLEVAPVEGGWRIADVGSANGTFADGAQITSLDLESREAGGANAVEVQVGNGGPFLKLSLGDASASRTTNAPPDPASQPRDAGAVTAPALEADPFRPHPPTEPATFVGEPSSRTREDAHASGPASTPQPVPPTEAGIQSGGLHGRDDTPSRPSEPPAAPHLTLVGGPTPGPAPEPVVSTLAEDLTEQELRDRYFGEGPSDGPVGERTQFIRQAYDEIKKTQEVAQKKERSKYRGWIAAVAVVALGAAGYAGFLQYRAIQYRAQAEELFYQLKTFEISIAEQVQDIQDEIESNPERADSLNVDLERALEARRQTAARYDRFVRDLGVYDGLSSKEELIYKTARAFGESELAIPPAFVDEVSVQINYWANGGRFVRGIRHAQANGFDVDAVNALRRHGMPTEFFYLALQESDFNTRAVGPPTRWGHAKGAWQFIPQTGERYGLEPGPLVSTNQYDPMDERHDFNLAADAAARYLHDIYTRISQASGLLVCASYNWGEGRIQRNMRGIANDPASRTYWRFLTEYRNRMPNETKDYVMKIFAAAVVGQNPRLFGIDMDPPVQRALAGGTGGIRTEGPASGRTTRLGTDAVDAQRSAGP
ncbi:transglycosylase SLT domain-containing protein [Rubrivirga sp.]|uniref:transglycosylase SLT domain-containing protein n=1 Tax=Rubrivirga sp. TaxID=1885344 RepID=UPI003C741A2E